MIDRNNDEDRHEVQTLPGSTIHDYRVLGWYASLVGKPWLKFGPCRITNHGERHGLPEGAGRLAGVVITDKSEGASFFRASVTATFGQGEGA